ncbi:hypothetical protein HanXRQr2_Chr02g0055191 [Helianthus annuus]|uniref:Uncharacterized protein n=1 Tax=Helianthus annuus TaxID=4232 RepID=A0A9K3JLR5_HELAN|nr:hypothetical protein HanXRQr2_Chr02g0055191 [Helianthus annuus]
MMDGAEIVCSEVVYKVEEENCGSSMNAVGGVATVVYNVISNSNCNGNDGFACVCERECRGECW